MTDGTEVRAEDTRVNDLVHVVTERATATGVVVARAVDVPADGMVTLWISPDRWEVVLHRGGTVTRIHSHTERYKAGRGPLGAVDERDMPQPPRDPDVRERDHPGGGR